MARKTTVSTCVLILLCVLHGVAAAEQRDRWQHWNERKQQAHIEQRRTGLQRADGEISASPVVASPLTLTSVRVFPDAFGDIVVIGEVHNDTASTLTFAKVTFEFFNGGVSVGRDWTYVFGTENVRLNASRIYTDALRPGAFGFFKLYTSIPYSSVTTRFDSEAETYAVSSPIGAAALQGAIRLTSDSFGGTEFSAAVKNTNAHARLFFVQLALAGYHGGALNDVTLSYVDGVAVTCGSVTTETGIDPQQSAAVSGFFLRPVSTIGRSLITWDEQAVSPGTAALPASGGTGSFQVLSGGCPWTALPTASWLTVVAGASGASDGTVTYVAAPNVTGTARTGSIVVNGMTFTVTQAAGGGTITVNRSSLRFSAVTTGAGFVSQTAAQSVRVTQTGSGIVTWHAVSDQPWLTVSPASGSGSGTLSVGVRLTGGLPPSGTASGTITVTATGGVAVPIAVMLTLVPPAAAAAPFGMIDTPMENASGLTGTVPFTGWALDDVEVTGVALCRGAVAGEAAPIDPRCGGAAQVYIGNAVFIDGARPDVAASFASHPLSTRAGWGFAVLTNMLPNQGNGRYTFYFYLSDRDGHRALLGTRTITCTNATATTPFGAIDTPGQGETISGSAYVNFGWALTPQPKTIPADGSTITVFVDGTPVGTVDYNHFRSDIATLFPGLNNTNGAVGLRVIDTTKLSNGVHTIAWGVRDSAGSATGVGSRFFTVSNGAGRPDFAAAGFSEADAVASGFSRTNSLIDVDVVREINAAALEGAAIAGRRGWDLEAPLRRYRISAAGIVTIHGEELDRFELHIARDSHSASAIAGYLRAGDALEPLPIGSQLDPATGVFTWHPGVGFVGAYDLVFVRWAAGRAVARQEVRVVLNPKGSGRVGPQVVIDSPRMFSEVGRTFYIGGWAADLDAEFGTGISTLHVWAYPASGGRAFFLGVPAMNAARPDVAAVYGDQFRDTGWGLVVRSLPPGVYDLAVFASRESTGAFLPAKVVRVRVTP